MQPYYNWIHFSSCTSGQVVSCIKRHVLSNKRLTSMQQYDILRNMHKKNWSGSFLILGWQHQSQRGFLYYTYVYIFRLIMRLYGYISSGHDAQDSYAVRARTQVWRPSYLFIICPMHINWPIQYNMCRVWTLLVRRPRRLIEVYYIGWHSVTLNQTRWRMSKWSRTVCVNALLCG